MFRISSLALALCLASSRHAKAFSVTPAVGLTTNAPPAFLPTAVRARPASIARYMLADAESGASSVLVRKPDSAVEVTLTAPGSATKAAYDRACSELSKNINIPGFRKGAKIPPAVIENAMAAKGGKNAIRAQAINSLVGGLIESALKDEHGLDPIGQPSLVTPAEELADSFQPGEAIELVVKCDVWPDIRWKEGSDKPYLGLKGTYKRKPFNQAKFDAALNDLRDRYATLEPMEDEGAALAMGDACVVNMDGYMANADGTKGDPLPNAASGDHVEVILGKGRYMDGLVEGLVGAKVGDTKEVSVSFPTALKDKTLAGKRAVFDVTVEQASHRKIPELNDEFANEVRAGLTVESLKEELRKAVDAEDAKEFVNERNEALSKALAEVMEVDVPDTLVTNQAREQYAQMMTEMRDNGMADEEIKKLISPENFLKYKDISKEGIVKDFRVSMATDEIARVEGIEVPADQVEEQLQALTKEAADQGDQDFDPDQLRGKVETTLMRRLVFDFLAEHADLDVEYVEEKFDEEMLEKLAEESLAREQTMAADCAPEEVSS